EAVTRAHRDGLVPHGVRRRGEDAHAVGDLTIAIHRRVGDTREVHPLADRVSELAGRVELAALRDDGHARERAVLTAVVEVEMGVHDRADILWLEVGGGERVTDVATYRPVAFIDPVVPGADAGVDEDDARGVA